MVQGEMRFRSYPSIAWQEYGAHCAFNRLGHNHVATGRVAGTGIGVRTKLAFLYSTLRMRLSTSVVRPTEAPTGKVHVVSREVHPCRGPIFDR